jgi:hypothetical protein
MTGRHRTESVLFNEAWRATGGKGGAPQHGFYDAYQRLRQAVAWAAIAPDPRRARSFCYEYATRTISLIILARGSHHRHTLPVRLSVRGCSFQFGRTSMVGRRLVGIR